MDYLRNMMQDVGTSNRLGVFYVFSAHSVDSHFIEHVNTILAHGVTLGVRIARRTNSFTAVKNNDVATVEDFQYVQTVLMNVLNHKTVTTTLIK